MNKQEVKSLLMSMRTENNQNIVNYLLGKIDLMDKKSIDEAVKKAGGTEKSIHDFLERKIAEVESRVQHDDHKPVNKMFTYGRSGSCLHLHLPGDLHGMIEKKGISGTINTVNLYLLDAIDRLNRAKQSGMYADIDSIYMISPILLGRELKFLENLDFETHSFKKSQLKDPDFLNKTPEAKLAVSIFGDDKTVGTARIGFDRINSDKWQEKKKSTISEINKKGITISEDSISK